MKLDFETQKWLAEPTLLLGFAREIKTALDDFWNGHHIEGFINTFGPAEVCASVAQLRSRIRAWRRQNMTQGDDFVANSAVACGYVDSVPYGLIGEHSWWGSERPPESDRWFHSWLHNGLGIGVMGCCAFQSHNPAFQWRLIPLILHVSFLPMIL